MTDQEWLVLAGLLSKGFKWRDPFDEAAEDAYRVLLDGYGAEQIGVALRKLVARGQVFGPTPGELVAAIREDPSRPTLDEALVLIRRALRAGRRPLVGDFGSEAEMLRAREDLVRDATADMHPLVASFVTRCGDLRRLEDEVAEVVAESVDGLGGLRRRDFTERWERHCEAADGREVAAIASGCGREGLRQLDPLAALGVRGPAGELEAGGQR